MYTALRLGKSCTCNTPLRSEHMQVTRRSLPSCSAQYGVSTVCEEPFTCECTCILASVRWYCCGDVMRASVYHRTGSSLMPTQGLKSGAKMNAHTTHTTRVNVALGPVAGTHPFSHSESKSQCHFQHHHRLCSLAERKPQIQCKTHTHTQVRVSTKVCGGTQANTPRRVTDTPRMRGLRRL